MGPAQLGLCLCVTRVAGASDTTRSHTGDASQRSPGCVCWSTSIMAIGKARSTLSPRSLGRWRRGWRTTVVAATFRALELASLMGLGSLRRTAASSRPLSYGRCHALRRRAEHLSGRREQRQGLDGTCGLGVWSWQGSERLLGAQGWNAATERMLGMAPGANVERMECGIHHDRAKHDSP